MRKTLLTLAVTFFILTHTTAAAQDSPWAALFGINTDDFPRVSAWVTAWDGEGQFLAGIQASDVQVLEDGEKRAIAAWEEAQPGAQVVIAIEAGRALGVRDALGVSRYEYIYHQIRSWAEQPPDAPYDLSLVTSDGVQATHLADFTAFTQALDAYQPTTKATETGLQALAAGIEIASDTPPRAGMGRGLLWITPMPSDDALQNLGQYLALAQQARLRVDIWLVGAPALQDDPRAQTLRDFATSTHGQITFFSGSETLPVLGDRFAPLTHAYRLTYLSEAIHGEQHTLQITLTPPQGEAITTNAVTFPFALQPPEVVLLDPPRQIVRKAANGDNGTPVWQPTQVEIAIGVTFPDNHPRELEKVALMVDGQTVAQQTAPPYDHLTWDISTYAHSGTHTLQAEAEDIYGFTVHSQPITVQLTIVQPPDTFTATLSNHRRPFTWGIIALSGLVLFIVLLQGWRTTHRPTLATSETHTTPKRSRFSFEKGIPQWLPWRGKTSSPNTLQQALAYLIPLSAEGEGEGEDAPTPSPLTITAAEATLGSDPAVADIVITDPSIDPLHARLWHTDEGNFFIADQRSTAGTWLNYAPVSPEGARLHNGDLIHLGRVGFRFVLTPEENLRVVITPL